MNDYIALHISASPCNEDICDLLAAFLADEGYESFVTDSEGFTAYIPSKDFSEEVVRNIVEYFPVETVLNYSSEFIPGQDWNHEWEKNYFQPILLGDKCVIHSTFHKDIPKAKYDISIDPKMAFGTGHHSTTRLILGYLLSSDLKNKSVIDMGAGTGILSILCCMCGAEPVTGIEIDPMAHANSLENKHLNGVSPTFILGDARMLDSLDPADLFLANINRNIILADMQSYSERLKQGGKMILSGFYDKDIPMLERAGKLYNLRKTESHTDGEWAMLVLEKSI